jgi:hypothetical protein
VLLSELKWTNFDSAGYGRSLDVYDPHIRERYAIYREGDNHYKVYRWPITRVGWTDPIYLDELTLACLIAPCEIAHTFHEWKKLRNDYLTTTSRVLI